MAQLGKILKKHNDYTKLLISLVTTKLFSMNNKYILYPKYLIEINKMFFFLLE